MMGQCVFVRELFEKTCSRHSSKVVFFLASHPHFPVSSCRFCGSLWSHHSCITGIYVMASSWGEHGFCVCGTYSTTIGMKYKDLPLISLGG